MFEASEFPSRKEVFETSVSGLTPTLDEFGDRASMSQGSALELIELELLEAGDWRPETRGRRLEAGDSRLEAGGSRG